MYLAISQPPKKRVQLSRKRVYLYSIRRLVGGGNPSLCFVTNDPSTSLYFRYERRVRCRTTLVTNWKTLDTTQPNPTRSPEPRHPVNRCGDAFSSLMGGIRLMCRIGCVGCVGCDDRQSGCIYVEVALTEQERKRKDFVMRGPYFMLRFIITAHSPMFSMDLLFRVPRPNETQSSPLCFPGSRERMRWF